MPGQKLRLLPKSALSLLVGVPPVSICGVPGFIVLVTTPLWGYTVFDLINAHALISAPPNKKKSKIALISPHGHKVSLGLT